MLKNKEKFEEVLVVVYTNMKVAQKLIPDWD